MRIAQVAPLYESVPPQLYGGTERVVSYLTEALVEVGEDVTLFASGDSATSAELVPVCDQALRLDANCRDYLAHHILMLEQVMQQSHDFDIIHFHCDYLHFSLSRRHAYTHVTTLHGRLDMPELQPLYREFREAPVVSISDAQRLPLPHARWAGTVYHGLPLDLYTPHQTAGEYLAFLGRISPEKRVDRAVEIAIQTGIPLRVAAKVDNADKDYFDESIKPLFERAGSAVEFIGEIGEKDKNDFLGKARALVFPIDWPEPFGLVMIEAMACGTPTIAFRCGSVPEVIETERTGFIVSDVEEAVAVAGRLDKLDRGEIRRVFEDQFSAERMAENYLRVYQTLIDPRRTADWDGAAWRRRAMAKSNRNNDSSVTTTMTKPTATKTPTVTKNPALTDTVVAGT